MNLLQYFSRQFEYDAWANREVLSAIRTGSAELQTRPLQLLAHIVAAEKLWLERLNQQPQSVAVWPEAGVAQCEMQIAELSRLWRNYFSGLSESNLADIVNYKNSKGEPWSGRVEDILTHVALHSAYHRGQIAGAMRKSGATPAYTDFIHAVRQGFIQ